jgi:hypothetical protein
VNSQVRTVSGWIALLENAGFEVEWRVTAIMHLLEPQRVIDDEGLIGALRFMKNVLTYSDARARVRHLCQTFTRHEQHMDATALVATKL